MSQEGEEENGAKMSFRGGSMDSPPSSPLLNFDSDDGDIDDILTQMERGWGLLWCCVLRRRLIEGDR